MLEITAFQGNGSIKNSIYLAFLSLDFVQTVIIYNLIMVGQSVCLKTISSSSSNPLYTVSVITYSSRFANWNHVSFAII